MSFKVYVLFSISWDFCHCVEKCIFLILLYLGDNWITGKMGNCFTFSAKKFYHDSVFIELVCQTLSRRHCNSNNDI